MPISMSGCLLKSRENEGVWCFNSELLDVSKPRTIVVSGVGRSGTTATVKVLQASGMAKVGHRRQRTQDDHTFGPLMESGDQKFLEYASCLDGIHDVWGYKWHLAWKYPIVRKLRQPIMVLVFRDNLAVALRASLENKDLDEREWVKYVALLQSQMACYAANETSIPVICVSYEKLIRKPNTVQRLVDLVGLEFSFSSLNAIKPECEKYLSRLWPKHEGPGEAFEWMLGDASSD